MKRFLILVLAIGLVPFVAACGADGEPTPPAPKVSASASTSGGASIGIQF